MRCLEADRALAQKPVPQADREPSAVFALRGPLQEAPAPRPDEGNRSAGEGRPRRRYRSWKAKSDDEVVAIARDVVRDNGVTSKTMLWKVDAGLADRIRERGLWERVGFLPKGVNRERACAKASGGGDAPGNGGSSQAGGGGPAQLNGGKAPDCPAAWEKDDVVFLAQSLIDEMRIADAAELGRLDPELHALIEELGAGAGLGFHPEPPARRADDGPAGAPPEGVVPMQSMSAEQLRKADLHGAAISEEMAYRLILADCFRLGTANPFIGGVRATVPKLQGNINRRLNGPQHKTFRKCWDRMVAEGVVAHNSNGSAASVDPDPAPVRDGALRSALAWALSEQSKVSPEWRAKIG
jgi:hypothetical protein